MNLILESYLEKLQTEVAVPKIASAFRARVWRLINSLAKNKEEANKMWNNFVTKYENFHKKSNL